MITLKMLQEMFANMRRDGDMNLDGDLLWGYFFTDLDPKKLEPVATRLDSLGFSVVDLYLSGDSKTYFLHVERVETHSPDSLHARNQEFYRIAEEFGIESYDGMDVGPVQAPKTSQTPNKSPEPTAVGAGRSASRTKGLVRRWLSFFR
jgi:hypothetical protein